MRTLLLLFRSDADLFWQSDDTFIHLISHLITVCVTPHHEDMRTLKIAEQDVMELIRNRRRLVSVFGMHMG